MMILFPLVDRDWGVVVVNGVCYISNTLVLVWLIICSMNSPD